ncbi:MAG: hypothetical protein RL131_944 [Bacteroidota bacterium]
MYFPPAETACNWPSPDGPFDDFPAFPQLDIKKPSNRRLQAEIVMPFMFISNLVSIATNIYQFEGSLFHLTR